MLPATIPRLLPRIALVAVTSTGQQLDAMHVNRAFQEYFEDYFRHSDVVSMEMEVTVLQAAANDTTADIWVQPEVVFLASSPPSAHALERTVLDYLESPDGRQQLADVLAEIGVEQVDELTVGNHFVPPPPMVASSMEASVAPTGVPRSRTRIWLRPGIIAVLIVGGVLVFLLSAPVAARISR